MISSRLPHMVVLMLTASDDDADLFESLRRGAAGYLLKDMDPAKLPVTVRAALEGEAALPRHLTAHLIQEYSEHPRYGGWRASPPGVPD